MFASLDTHSPIALFLPSPQHWESSTRVRTFTLPFNCPLLITLKSSRESRQENRYREYVLLIDNPLIPVYLLTPMATVQVQSAFMIDLNQVSLALRNATSRSLVLLDEFGKGTVSSGMFSKNDHQHE